MGRGTKAREHSERHFVTLCKALASFSNRLPYLPRLSARALSARTQRDEEGQYAGRDAQQARRRALANDLERSAIPLEAETLLSAARGLAAATIVTPLALLALSLKSSSLDLAVLSAFLSVVVPILTREALLSYPRMVASKRALLIVRSSTDEVGLMIMSLRHEASLPKAMAIAAKRGSEFAGELREAIWSVMVGVHSTFEDALNQLAIRWHSHCEELKPAVRAVITASCEGTEAGRRRALDRANEALVAGAKRRIEEYTLALSVPSMILFGIGILLPLMVGAFLPMLSWDFIAPDRSSIGTSEPHADGTVLQTVLLMNVIFPAIALLIAADAVSKHPMTRPRTCTREKSGARRLAAAALVAFTCSASGVAAAVMFLEGQAEYVSCVLAVSTPVAILLMAHGSRPATAGDRERREQVEDLLFGAGARMVDGENLEAAIRAASADLQATNLPILARWDAHQETQSLEDELNEEKALEVVIEAAAKDEAQAGMLAMDLAGYARDVAELEAVLKRRLRPTLSMMRMTTHALAPIMLGVTHAIYISLTSIGSGAGGLSPGTLFVVLAAFLVEINAIVAYFAWGISDRRHLGSLAYSTGACVLVAVFIMAAVALATG